ncbi:MAG: alanine--tRNA ligase [Caulobacterales bacterium]
MASVSDIRASFLSYFRAHGHATPASSSLVPHDDPTLLFTNAGMVQFKNNFTGAQAPATPRAATSQKCVRAGGKHNDLDNVGYTARHHTFFEMLGNFSFGDYFKDEAIAFAWALITKEWGLAKDRLCVTVYHDDDEAAAIWKKVAGLPEDRIIRIATSDNFWSMGDTGPCGPCSEIFYDHGAHIYGGPPGSKEEDGDRFVEIWNLVFMQFEQFADGTRKPLPKPSIDTGMGLERVAAVLQGVHSNYETDLFQRLIAESVSLTGVEAQGSHTASHRVIADHLRASCFLIADGVTPANEGRGYVLRRIMRRAMRHAHILGTKDPLMHRLVPNLIALMGQAYPELGRAEPVIVDQLRQEEERFRRTLGRGLALLEEEMAGLGPNQSLSGRTAFKLYDTFGFPLDLTQDILRARGLKVDEAAYTAAMDEQRRQGQESWVGAGAGADEQVWHDLASTTPATTFLGYVAQEAQAKLSAIVSEKGHVQGLKAPASAELVFDHSPFYAESGGQAGDKGQIHFASGAIFEVTDTQKRPGTLHAHSGTLVAGTIKSGDSATLTVDPDRRSRLRANHSATHLLHAALRRVLGTHVSQKGSLVEADRFRFDFSHNAPITPEELERIEDEVNAVVRQNEAVDTREMAPEAAIAAGALALFGEKYGENVRVLTMGLGLDDASKPFSVELCGGTHVRRTGDIAAFAILSESGVSAGVRRIEATTGAGAIAHWRTQANLAKAVAGVLKAPLADIPDRAAVLMEERRKAERELAEARKRLALVGDAAGPAAGPEVVAGIKLIARVLEGVPAKDLRSLVDEGKTTLGEGVVAYIGIDAGKAALAVGVTEALSKKVSAVDLVRAGVLALGGQGGGGRPDMAQGGGPEAAKAEDALAAVRAALEAAKP